MKRKLLLLMLMVIAMSGLAQQEDHLVVQYDFSKVSGTTVTDNVSGINGKLMNSASVQEMGAYKVLNLGNGTGYFNMTSNVGGKLRQMDEFSISTYYRVDKAASLSRSLHRLSSERAAHGYLCRWMGRRSRYGDRNCR